MRSPRGTAFRQWATARLTELLVKGFTLDDERIKAGRTLGADYFEELLNRIRDIRASERLFYQKVTDIYATSIDYDANAEMTRQFFQVVQNKMHWAAHGHTAAPPRSSRSERDGDHHQTTFVTRTSSPNMSTIFTATVVSSAGAGSSYLPSTRSDFRSGTSARVTFRTRPS